MKRTPLTIILLMLIICLVIFNIFSGYINSWLINFPVPSIGSVLRDATLILLITLAIARAMFAQQSIPRVVAAWLICCIYMAALIPFAPNAMYALLGFRNIAYPLAGVALIYFTYSLKTNLSFSIAISLCLKSILLVVATLGVLDYATDGEFIYALGFNPEYNEFVALMVRHHLGLTRANAGVSDALNFGYLMAFSSIYALYLMESNKYQARSTFCLNLFPRVLFIASFAACVLSITRGAILAVVVAIVLRYLLRKLIFLPLLIVILATGSFVQLAPQLDGLSEVLYDRFSQEDSGSELSSHQRIDAALHSMELIRADPLLGVGLGTQGAPSYFDQDDKRVATDNSFLWILLDTGVLGFLIIMLSYYSIFAYLYKIKAGRNYREFVALSGVILFFAASLSSAPLSPTLAITFWLLLVSEAQISEMKLNHRKL